ncbi:MAG: DUF692 domain-containing protein [Polyangiaceae bacterium]
MTQHPIVDRPENTPARAQREPRATGRGARLGLPDLGIGAGLRIPHYPAVLDAPEPVAIDWFEIISENFMAAGGRPMANLDRALDRYRLVQHGVSLSIGSTDPLDWDYLAKVKALIKKTKTPWVSDHLCWTGADGADLHDLCPLPYNEEVARYVAERARIVQDYLETRLLLENVSSYLTYTHSTMTEWAFVTAVIEEADLGLLLDVNNIYVSSENHTFDPNEFVDGVPIERVVQVHLAGHTRFEKYIIDTHSGHVVDPVWELYERAIRRIGSVATMIEWDDEIPPYETLAAELGKVREVRDRALRARGELVDATAEGVQ